jgi:putative transposase
MVRNSLKYVSWKDRKQLVADLQKIYHSATERQAEIALSGFKKTWDTKYPAVTAMWERRWTNIIPFFEFSPEIRKVIYTTNAIESLNMTLRKVLKNKRAFPSDDAALKQIYLALRNISRRWTMPIQNWGPAIMQLSVHFEGRLSL